MRFKKYLNEQTNINWEGMNLDQLIDFFSDIQVGRKPKNVGKTDHELVKEIKSLTSSIEQLKKKSSDFLGTKPFELQGRLQNLRLSKQDLESNYKKSDKSVIESKGLRYINQSSISQEKFENAIKDINSFISELKGYHKKVLKKLTIRFVDSKDLKSVAKYLTDEDVLLINPKKVGKTKEEYGSLRYVFLHELGHRFLKMFPQKWDYKDNKWVTTKYSGIDSFTDEEKFAELFAISHWKNKYKEFSDKIKEFEKRIEN